jgi:N-acetyltransferase
VEETHSVRPKNNDRINLQYKLKRLAQKYFSVIRQVLCFRTPTVRIELAKSKQAQVEICPISLEGKNVRLEPLTASHESSLIAAAGDGELWKSTVTTVPGHTNMASYIQDALHGEVQGVELPFVIIQKALDKVVGTTRFYEIRRLHRGVAIGYTWLAASAQRTAVNTEAKLLMLTHAFENWRCIRVEFMTHVLNKQSREAILRLGAKEEAILRSHMIMPDGRIRDSVCFSIILEEWPEIKTRLANRLSTQ